MASRTRKAADATVAPQQYAEGEGFEIGQRATSTKYVDVDGNVSDELPEDGGWVAVQAGDVITPAVYARLNPDSTVVSSVTDPDLTVKLDNSGFDSAQQVDDANSGDDS